MNFLRGIAYGTLSLGLSCAWGAGCAGGEDLPSTGPRSDSGTPETTSDGGGAACSEEDGAKKLATSKAEVTSIAANSAYVYWALNDTTKPLKGTILRTTGDTAPTEFSARETPVYGLLLNDEAAYWMQADGAVNKIVRLKHSAVGGGSSLIVSVTDEPKGFAINTSNVYAAGKDGVSTYPLEGAAAGSHLKLKKSGTGDAGTEFNITPKAVAVNENNLVVVDETEGVLVSDTNGSGAKSLEDGSLSLQGFAAVDADNAYWFDAKKIRRVDLTESSSGSAKTLDTGATAMSALSNKIFWSSFDESLGGLVRKASGLTGSPQVFILRKPKVVAVAATSSYIYWVEGSIESGFCIMRKSTS